MKSLEIRQHTAQYFASQLLNLAWVKHGAGPHELYRAGADLTDEAGHRLITAYAVKRPGGDWSLLLINKDPSNAHEVALEFVADGIGSGVARLVGSAKRVTFGTSEYVWHPAGPSSYADPDGPAKTEVQDYVRPPKADTAQGLNDHPYRQGDYDWKLRRDERYRSANFRH